MGGDARGASSFHAPATEAGCQSEFRHVHWYEPTKQWRARVGCVTIGYFHALDEREAALAVDKWRLRQGKAEVNDHILNPELGNPGVNRFRGVAWDGVTEKFNATIFHNYESIDLGDFSSDWAAGMAVDRGYTERGRYPVNADILTDVEERRVVQKKGAPRYQGVTQYHTNDAKQYKWHAEYRGQFETVMCLGFYASEEEAAIAVDKCCAEQGVDPCNSRALRGQVEDVNDPVYAKPRPRAPPAQSSGPWEGAAAAAAAAAAPPPPNPPPPPAAAAAPSPLAARARSRHEIAAEQAAKSLGYAAVADGKTCVCAELPAAPAVPDDLGELRELKDCCVAEKRRLRAKRKAAGDDGGWNSEDSADERDNMEELVVLRGKIRLALLVPMATPCRGNSRVTPAPGRGGGGGSGGGKRRRLAGWLADV